MVAAGASALTAAWLLLAVVTVLPARDPASIPFWTVFSVALLAFVALTVIDVRRGIVGRAARIVVAVMSVLAILVGGWILIASMSMTGHFEGYLVVIGLVAVVHGLALLARLVIRPGRVAISR